MRRRTWIWALLLMGVTLATAGCVVLSGQRITFRHDQPNDRLTVWIHYDGIFDTEQDTTEGSKELREFVAKGQVMIVDWFGRLPIGEWLAPFDPDIPPAARALLYSMQENVHVRALGHYRDFEGRIGAVQEVRVEHVSEFMERANAALDEALLSGEFDPFEEGQEDLRDSVLAAARRGHVWLRFDGNALVADIPARFEDWQRVEYRLLAELIDDLFEDPPQRQEDPREAEAQALWPAHFYSSVGLSVEKHAEHVLLRMGLPDRPTTLRFPYRNGYRPNLEALVQELVPEDYDALLLQRLLGHEPQGAEGEAWAGEMPLPEDKVRALVGALEHGDPDRRQAAATWLDEHGATWNVARHFPRAPGADLPASRQIAEWKHWYEVLVGSLD